MLEMAEEVKDYYAEKMSGLLEAKKVVEVAPGGQPSITQSAKLRNARPWPKSPEAG